jgi:glycosyltransferase involved in cell wall biosynthesis
MKILVNGLTIEGGNIVPLLLKIKTWQAKGSEVSIVGNKELKEQIEKLGVLKKDCRFIELTCTKRVEDKFYLIFEGLRRNLRLIKRIRDFDGFDVVYSISSVLDLILFPFFLKIANKKIKWATVFDNIVPLNNLGNRVARLLAWLFFHLSLILLRKADYVFTISKDLNDYLIRKGFNEKKIILTGNAVEADLIKKARRDKRYNIDALFVGRVNEAKGIDDMLDVLGIIRKKHPDFQLAIVGKGDITTERKYKRKIKDRKLERNIQFLGYKTGLEKFNIIKSSKIFLFLSKTESFGIALLEAVCSGIPAIAYDLPAYRGIYRNGEVFLFKKNDYQSVAEKLEEIIDKKLFGNEKGKLLLRQYSWDTIAEREYKAFVQKYEV